MTMVLISLSTLLNDELLIAHADEVVLSNCLTLPRVLIRKDFPPRKTIKFLIPWFRFISQNEVGVYWDRIEQIGIYVKEDFARATTLFSLECSLHSLNKVGSMTQQLNHQRFSFTAFGMLLAGPASLINHACSNCSNAILDFGALQVVVNADYVLAPGRLYITYNDEPTLLQHRGISCLMCRFLKNSFIYTAVFTIHINLSKHQILGRWHNEFSSTQCECLKT